MKKSISQLFEEFIFECEYARKLRPETLKGYRDEFRLLMSLKPNISIETITGREIADYFQILQNRKRIVGKGVVKTGVKKSTVANHWSRLNSFLRWLKRRNYISDNPLDGIKFPRPVYEDKKFLKREEIEKILTGILSNSSTSSLLLKRNLTIFYLLLFCGLRREELLLLQVRDIDLNRKIITIRAETSKIPRTRHLPIHSQLAYHLKEYLLERKRYTTPILIVSSTSDRGMSFAALKHWVQTLRNQIGIHFHLHRFRHTFAVNFLKHSNNIAKLKQLMGHSDIRMTIQYLRCLPTKEMRGDIESMNIDNLI